MLTETVDEFPTAELTVVASSPEQGIRLDRLTKEFVSLARANGLHVEVRTSTRTTQSQIGRTR